MNRYRNPWHKHTQRTTPEFYTNDAECVATFQGVQVFPVNSHQHDLVFDGMCISQVAGFKFCERHVADLLSGESLCVQEIADHLRAAGHSPMSYDEYSALYAAGKIA